MSDEFKPTSDILTRSELTVIWNYWTGKYNLLHSQKGKDQEMRTIADYLKELKFRDKKLISINRSNAAKRRAEEKREAEEEAQRKKCEEEQYNKQLKLVFDAEFPAFDKECSDIDREIESLQDQIYILEQKKEQLQSDFQDKCVHRYGKEISDPYGDKWVICEICAERKYTYECSC
jgi:hypothetical protein